MKHFNLAVLGSGYHAVGLAQGAEDSLVVDEHFLVDPVHFGTLSGFTCDPCREFGREGAELYSDFESLSAICNGKIDICSAEAVLSGYVKKKGIPVLLGARKLGIRRQGGEYVIKLHTSAGETEIAARCVIEHPYHEPDSLRFLVRGDMGSFSPGNTADAALTLSKAFAPDEFLLTVRMNKAMEPHLLKARALHIAAEAVRKADAKIITVASSAFSSEFFDSAVDPISDFEMGLDRGRRLAR